MSLILSNTAGKSHLIHFIDMLGHINFVNEVASAVVEVVCDLFIKETKILFHPLAYGWHGMSSETCPTKRASKLH